MWRRVLDLLLLCIVVSGTLSCGSIPYRTSRNQPTCPEGSTYTSFVKDHEKPCVASAKEPVTMSGKAVSRARAEFGSNDADVPKVFVGLAISGGGSRAANFGLATMEQLKEIGVLQHMSAISTTSGGGLPGAYYALHDGNINWGRARELMATNFVNKWIVKNVLPQNLLSTSFTHEDRSDLMMDVFDRTLFSNARYEQLQNFEVGTRPIWLANATNIRLSDRFTFSNENFRTIRSDLATFPISQAVVASAAFPGVFNSVTLKSYPEALPLNGRWHSTPEQYEHLIDGGPSDNLGIEALLQLATSHQRETRRTRGDWEADKRCLLVVVDAYPVGVPGKLAWQPDPRAWYDHLIDLNFLTAFDALLTRRRTDLLGYLGVQPYEQRPYPQERQFIEIDVPLAVGNEISLGQVRRVGDFTQEEIEARLRAGEAGKPIPVPPNHFRCAVWHINLSGIYAVLPYIENSESGRPERMPLGAHRDDPVSVYRQKLHRVVSQINTNFKLVGPAGCSPEFLQKALYAAAFVLVREDQNSRSKACRWMKEAGLATTDRCEQFPGNKAMQMLSLDIVEPDSALAEKGMAQHEAVHCRRESSTQ